MLEVLDVTGIKATFFVLGRKIADAKGRAMAREAAAITPSRTACRSAACATTSRPSPRSWMRRA
ncbi:MAG: hypothetical protein ACT4P4_21560 [Betaproteobacteria bacterium]